MLTRSAFYVWVREHLRKRKWQSNASERIEFRFEPNTPNLPGAPPPPPQGMKAPNKLAPTNRVPLKQYRENLREMATLATESGAKPVFLILPSARDLLIGRVGDFRDAYRQAMKEVADELNAPLVDSSKRFLEGDLNALFFDEVHPTAKGHQRIAESLLSSVIELNKP